MHGATSRDGYRLDTLDRFIGQELGVSDWRKIDQEQIDRFAACTGDDQWIHVDVERASRESPFGTTVAHGYLVVSLLARFTFELGIVPDDASQAINYGAERIRFSAPVRAGARIRDRVVLLAAEGKGPGRVLITTRHTVELEDSTSAGHVADVPVHVSGDGSQTPAELRHVVALDLYLQVV